MGSGRRRLRGFALTWGVLQFMLPLAILFGDATSALTGSRHPQTHVEESSSKTCQPVHADECALCRFLSNGATPAPRPEAPLVAASAGQAQPDVPRTALATDIRRLPDSRAPPIA